MCMKMPVMLKYQQFGDSGNIMIEPRGWNPQRLDERDNEEGNGLNNEEGKGLDDKEGNSLGKDEGEIEGGRYVSSPFVPLLLLFQKVSNRLSDLGKETKSLKYIVYISKICYSRNANFALDFPGRGGSKVSKKDFYQPSKRGITVPLGFHSFHNFRHHQLPLPN